MCTRSAGLKILVAVIGQVREALKGFLLLHTINETPTSLESDLSAVGQRQTNDRASRSDHDM